MHRSEWQLRAETLLKLSISLPEAEALSRPASAAGVQTCCGGCTSATRGCRCRDSCWQRQAADVIDLSEAKQPKQPLHINPPRPQAYKYQHATGRDSDQTAADLRVSAPTSCLRLSLSVQMLRSSCVLPVLLLQLLLDRTCSAVLPDRNERVREPVRNLPSVPGFGSRVTTATSVGDASDPPFGFRLELLAQKHFKECKFATLLLPVV